jgi:hypothetical protein
MLANQMLMALFLGIGNLRFPSPILHDFLGPEDSILETVGDALSRRPHAAIGGG